MTRLVGATLGERLGPRNHGTEVGHFFSLFSSCKKDPFAPLLDNNTRKNRRWIVMALPAASRVQKM